MHCIRAQTLSKKSLLNKPIDHLTVRTIKTLSTDIKFNAEQWTKRIKAGEKEAKKEKKMPKKEKNGG